MLWEMPRSCLVPRLLSEPQHYLAMQVEEEQLSVEEAKERKIMKMLLKVKNGTPPQRKSALRQLTDKARDFGAGPLFNQILPLLMSPTLEDQERHLLVKVGHLLPPSSCPAVHELRADLHLVYGYFKASSCMHLSIFQAYVVVHRPHRRLLQTRFTCTQS